MRLRGDGAKLQGLPGSAVGALLLPDWDGRGMELLLFAVLAVFAVFAVLVVFAVVKGAVFAVFVCGT